MSYTICKQCGSDVLDVEDESQTGEPALWKCHCHECGRRWLETGTYELVRVLECGNQANSPRTQDSA